MQVVLHDGEQTFFAHILPTFYKKQLHFINCINHCNVDFPMFFMSPLLPLGVFLGFKSHLAHDKGLIRTRLIEVFGGRVWASGAAVMSFLQNTCQTCDNTYRLQRSTCLAAIAITAVS